MKKLPTCVLLNILLTWFSLPSIAQKSTSNEILNHRVPENFFVTGLMNTNRYTFTVKTEVYNNLTGATLISGGVLWDDPTYYGIPLGFMFKFFDSTYTTTDVLDGAVEFETENLLVAYGGDLIDRGDISGVPQSPISYKVEGTPGNRIFKLEWKNFGFYEEGVLNGTLNWYGNSQLWLYETSNNIDVRIGPNSVAQPTVAFSTDLGPGVGMGDYTTGELFGLMGNPANPTLVDSNVTLSGVPANGIVYQFKRNLIGIDEYKNSGIQLNVYATGGSGIYYFESSYNPFGKNIVEVTDIHGRILTSKEIYTHRNRFDLSALSPGIYFARLSVGTASRSVKLIIL